MIITVILQLSGAILLAYGLAFRKRKEIIEQSIAKSLIYEVENPTVPKIIEEKWNETLLCRYGLIYTILGYFIGMFEEELFYTFTWGIQYKIVIVLIFVLNLTVVTAIVSRHQAKEKYDATSFNDVQKNLGPDTIFYKITGKSNTTVPDNSDE